MDLLARKTFCETCGSSLEVDMPSGFCPACLLTTALNSPDVPSSGSRIEDYELLSEIARGGMGIVYRARQRTPSRVVALKMILPAHLNSLGAIDRFLAEAEAAASLEHDGILPIYAVGEADGAPFYSMKFAEGGTLSARIDNYRDKPRQAAALPARAMPADRRAGRWCRRRSRQSSAMLRLRTGAQYRRRGQQGIIRDISLLHNAVL